jgi:hypothetical protein
MSEWTWSKSEKKIARKAFDAAYLREIREIEEKVKKRVNNFKEKNDVWKLHDFLTKRRREVDRKYDYRYSQLFMVFTQLMNEGYLLEEDLEGLSEDKIKSMKGYREYFGSSD